MAAGFALRGVSFSQPQEPSTRAMCVEESGMGLNTLPFVSSSHGEQGYQTCQGQCHALSRMLVSSEARERHARWVVWGGVEAGVR
jgi:hypothetical protein